MHTRFLLLFPALAGFTLLLLPATVSRAQTVINSLPYIIISPGDYVLGDDLIYSANSGFAITFNVGNVTLDFAGHYISNLGSGPGTTAYGLYGYDRANITVRNGTIAGFAYGISFSGSNGSAGNNTGNVVTNMRFPSNTTIGIAIFNPITCRVEGCQINKTGGSTAFSGSTEGIFISNGSVLLRNNQVSTVTSPDGGGTGYGILAYGSSRHFIVGNQIDTCTVGVATQGKYRNNLTANCTTPFSQGTDAGGNNSINEGFTIPSVWDGTDAGGND